MLSTKVKANINNLTDARYFAAAGVEWIGLSFNPDSPDYVDPEKAKALIEWLSGPQIVGAFRFQEPESICHVAETIGLDYVQLGARYTPDDCAKVHVPVIKEINASEATDPEQELEPFREAATFFLLDATGNNIPAPAALKKLSQNYPLILHMDFRPDNLLELLDDIQPAGIDLHGGGEQKTGTKNFEELDALLELLEKEA